MSPPEDAAPDIYFTPTPPRVVEVMLRLAQIGAGDVVYDLGCGDGQILIAAARHPGVRGVGIDADPKRLVEAHRAALAAGVADAVNFRREDLFQTDLRPANVITLYLLDSLNVRLRPRILEQCRPGTRVVSYSFEMGEWMADEHTPIAANGVFLWIVPADFSGRWLVSGAGDLAELSLTQHFQMLSGTVRFGERVVAIGEGRVNGDQFRLTLADSATSSPTILGARLDGDRLTGSLVTPDSTRTWIAERVGAR